MADRRDKRRKPPSSITTANSAKPSSKLNIDYLLNSSRTMTSSVPDKTSATYTRHGVPPSFNAIPKPKRKSKERPHECEMCGFSFGQRSDRNKHIRTVHFRERPYSCEYCSQSFGEKGNLYVLIYPTTTNYHLVLILCPRFSTSSSNFLTFGLCLFHKTFFYDLVAI